MHFLVLAAGSNGGSHGRDGRRWKICISWFHYFDDHLREKWKLHNIKFWAWKKSQQPDCFISFWFFLLDCILSFCLLCCIIQHVYIYNISLELNYDYWFCKKFTWYEFSVNHVYIRAIRDRSLKCCVRYKLKKKMNFLYCETNYFY